MKQNKKGSRVRSIKKMSCGHASTRLTEDKPKLKKRPHSMVSVLPSQRGEASPGKSTNPHPRSNTFSAAGKSPRHKPGRRGSRQKSPGNGNPSPLHGADEPRRKKKRDDKKRKQDREQKHSATKENLGSSAASLNPANVSVAVPVHLEEKEEEEVMVSPKKINPLGVSPSHSELSDISSIVDVAASLHSYSMRGSGRYLRRSNSLLLGNEPEIRRAKSDAHLLSGREERHHVCPPERKQFYRQIMKRINTGARHRIEPGQGGIHHVSRLRSENLALDNPFGPMWQQIWQEIQTFLGDMTQEEYDAFKYKIGEQLEETIVKITKFKIGSSLSPPKDEKPSCSSPPKPHTTKDHIHTVAKKLTFQNLTDSADSADMSSGRDSSGTIIGNDSSLIERRCRFDVGSRASVSSAGKENGGDPTNEDSIDASASLTSSATVTVPHSKTCKSTYCFNQFLSDLQLSTLDEVDGLLDELYTLESRYPNRQRLGEEHPHYNQLDFKVRHLALILWFKVTTSLADKLCTLSVWLEVPVVVPDLCREIGREGNRMTIGDAGHMTIGETVCSVYAEFNSPEHSPKSPRVTKGFILGTSDSGSENTPTSSLKKSHGFPRSDALDVTASLNLQSIDVTKSLVSSQLDQNVGPYRNFVNRGLKRKGLTYTVEVFIFSMYCKCSVKSSGKGCHPVQVFIYFLKLTHCFRMKSSINSCTCR